METTQPNNNCSLGSNQLDNSTPTTNTRLLSTSSPQTPTTTKPTEKPSRFDDTQSPQNPWKYTAPSSTKDPNNTSSYLCHHLHLPTNRITRNVANSNEVFTHQKDNACSCDTDLPGSKHYCTTNDDTDQSQNLPHSQPNILKSSSTVLPLSGVRREFYNQQGKLYYKNSKRKTVALNQEGGYQFRRSEVRGNLQDNLEILKRKIMSCKPHQKNYLDATCAVASYLLKHGPVVPTQELAKLYKKIKFFKQPSYNVIGIVSYPFKTFKYHAISNQRNGIYSREHQLRLFMTPLFH